ncbi:MAG: efflux RND transporter periplasmic adaptor subunit [Betaproteobacteria bacterium]
MNRIASSSSRGWWLGAAVLALLVAVLLAWKFSAPADATGAQPAAPPAPRPSLTVALTTPEQLDWPQTLAAQGSIAAWQEAVIGAELAGFRVDEVLVNVGDRVKKGQPLARVRAETVDADLAQARAGLAEAEAALAEAQANARRTRELADKGFISPQGGVQAATAEQTAAARVQAARARVQAEQVRMAQTRVLAPDDGVISARSATVGSLTGGQDLFKLIRGGRLEWRAEVPAADLDRLRPGLTARLTLPGGEAVPGTLRTVAPTVDPQTRNALVYVDLPAQSSARAGMFARGEFQLAQAPALTVPQSALLLRDGFAYVFKLESDNRVAQTKVAVGRRSGERVEIKDGLAAGTRIVASGVGFLNGGDVVRVVESAPAASASK